METVVARVVGRRRQRVVRPGSRRPDALGEEDRAAVVDLHVDVEGVHHPLVRVVDGQGGVAGPADGGSQADARDDLRLRLAAGRDQRQRGGAVSIREVHAARAPERGEGVCEDLTRERAG